MVVVLGEAEGGVEEVGAAEGELVGLVTLVMGMEGYDVGVWGREKRRCGAVMLDVDGVEAGVVRFSLGRILVGV